MLSLSSNYEKTSFIALENFKCVYCDKSQENDRGRRLVIRERCMSQISSFDHVLITRYHTNCILYSNQSFGHEFDHSILFQSTVSTNGFYAKSIIEQES